MAALRCKKGDMALIIKGDNTGKFVIVEQGPYYGTSGDVIFFEWNGENIKARLVQEQGHFWLCTCGSMLIDRRGDMRNFGLIEDKKLMPIRPPGPQAELPRFEETPNAAA